MPPKKASNYLEEELDDIKKSLESITEKLSNVGEQQAQIVSLLI